MGLDASVYCNCFETGRLRNPPRADYDVYVSEEGGLECRNTDLDTQMAFDAWRCNDACEHEDTTIIHHYIGNISLVGLLRQELSKQPDDLSMILTKVIYSGTHCGDFLTIDDIRDLQHEMPRLKNFQCGKADSQSFVDEFYAQLAELIECALTVNKPIVF